MLTTDEKRERLAQHDIEILVTRDIYSILMDGCSGYNSMDSETINEIYEEIFGKED